MSNQLTPAGLMAKAERACSSARVLLDLGDVDGACNRVYYAMFDAARAALLASGAPARPDIGKTHSGLINAFSEHLIKNGPVPKEIKKGSVREQCWHDSRTAYFGLSRDGYCSIG